MDCKEIREMYKLMFAEYPDIVTVKDLQAIIFLIVPHHNIKAQEKVTILRKLLTFA